MQGGKYPYVYVDGICLRRKLGQLLPVAQGRGLEGVKLIVGDKCLGMLETVGEVYPDAKYQRCTVHFHRNVFSVVPKSKAKLVAKMLKAIHAQESKAAALAKARDVVAALKELKLKETAKKVEDSVEETLAYMASPMSTGRASGRSAAAPVWWERSPTAIRECKTVCV